MQNYALTTWSNDRMLSYEPIVSASAGEATAFAQGLLTERTCNHLKMLAEQGIRYVVEHGHRSLQEVTSDHVAVAIGTWTINSPAHGSPLIWTSSDQEQDGAG